MSIIKRIGQTSEAAERKRIPMSAPVQKLEVDEIPGYHLHWFLSGPGRLERAVDGGYEYVDARDIQLNNTSLGGDSAISGNTDMGSRVSVVSGQEIGKDGQAVRLVLMKIKLEWWNEDQKLLEARNEQVRNALVGGMLGAERDTSGDSKQRYVDPARTKIPDFFKRKSPLAA